MTTDHTSIKAATLYLRAKEDARRARDNERRERNTFLLGVFAIALVVAMLSVIYVFHADAAEPPAALAVEPPVVKCFSTVQETMDYILPDDAGTPWNVLAVVKYTKRRVAMILAPDGENTTGYDLWRVTMRRGCPTEIHVYNFGWDRGWLKLAD
jgi:hypothetical protein